MIIIRTPREDYNPIIPKYLGSILCFYSGFRAYLVYSTLVHHRVLRFIVNSLLINVKYYYGCWTLRTYKEIHLALNLIYIAIINNISTINTNRAKLVLNKTPKESLQLWLLHSISALKNFKIQKKNPEFLSIGILNLGVLNTNHLLVLDLHIL